MVTKEKRIPEEIVTVHSALKNGSVMVALSSVI